jgi:hypothetical protein
MGFFKRLFSGATTTQGKADFYHFSVTCSRCGEVIEGRINLYNDLSVDYEQGNIYLARKVLMGSGHCFQQVEVELKFDSSRKLLEKKATGGKFVE